MQRRDVQKWVRGKRIVSYISQMGRLRSNLFFSIPRETSRNQFFYGILHARGTKCERIQAARRRFNERLTTATLTTPIPLERLLITRQRVFVFFSAPVLLRVVFPSVFRQRRRRRPFSSLTFVTLLSTIVNRSLFHCFYFLFLSTHRHRNGSI